MRGLRSAVPTRPAHRCPVDRRAYIEGGVLFFTAALADRSSDVLVRHINHFRHIYISVQQRWPFETVAICVLPDHIHAIWQLPPNDCDFSVRWSLIKRGFSRDLPVDPDRTPSKIANASAGCGNVDFGSM